MMKIKDSDGRWTKPWGWLFLIVVSSMAWGLIITIIV